MAEHRRNLPPAVDPAQLDLPACHEAEEQDQRGVFEPCVFTRRRNLSWSRSIVFVVRSVFHCPLGKRKNANYQRNIIALDGVQVLGQESGTGSIDSDGSINLKGGASTKRSTFTVEYKGKVSGSRVALAGTQMYTVPRQFTRDCTISLDRD